MARATKTPEKIAVFVAEDIADLMGRVADWIVDEYAEWNPVSVTFDWEEGPGWAATVVLGS